MIPLACASHLLVDLPLFGSPVLFLIGALLLIRRSDRPRYAPESSETSVGTGGSRLGVTGAR